MKKYLFTIAWILILFSCQKTYLYNTINVNSTTTKQTLNVKHKRLSIWQYKAKKSHKIALNSLFWETEPALAFLDNLDFRIEIYSLSTGHLKDSFRIKLFHDATYGTLHSLIVHSRDTILYFQDNAITLASDSVLHKRIEINGGNKDENLRLEYYAGFPHYLPHYKAGKIYLHQYCSACRHKTGRAMSIAHETVLDYHTGQAKALPVYYPLAFQKYNYGFMHWPTRQVAADRHCYAFQALPDLCVYFLQGDSILCNAQASAYQTEPSKTLNKKELENSSYKLQHFSLENTYQAALYDAPKKQYYRIFNPSLPEKNEEGLFNSFKDHASVLMVYNEKLELIAEIKITDKNTIRTVDALAQNGVIYNPSFEVEEEEEENIYSFYIDIYEIELF